MAQGLLEGTDLASVDGVLSEDVSSAIEALLKQNLGLLSGDGPYKARLVDANFDGC